MFGKEVLSKITNSIGPAKSFEFLEKNKNQTMYKFVVRKTKYLLIERKLPNSNQFDSALDIIKKQGSLQDATLIYNSQSSRSLFIVGKEVA